MTDWQLDETAAAELADRWVDVERVDVLYGEVDQNFRITDAGGNRSVLKVTRSSPERARDGVDLQLYLLGELAGGPEGVACSRPCTTRKGRQTEVVTDRQGGEHLAWMVSYLEGTLLDEVSAYDEILLQDLGASVARVDHRLIQASHPHADRAILWDLARVMELRPAVDTVTDASRQDLLARQFNDLEVQVLPRLTGCPRSIIHNDGGNQHNVLVSKTGSGSWRVCGLIDFGDAVLTHRICGLGIAAAYATFGHEEPAVAMGHVVRGYHHILPLSDVDIDLVEGLVRARLVMSLAISSHRARSEPENEYLQVSAEPAWRVLERLDQERVEARQQVVRGIVHDAD